MPALIFEWGYPVVTYVTKLNQMKHLLTLAALLFSTLSLAQQMPYNPDVNGDDFVGVDDVLGVLGVYDTALMQPDLECDFQGTDLEQLFAGLIAGSLVLDSLYLEYLLVDSVTTYLPECPDPVVIETVLERSFMFTASEVYENTDDAFYPNVTCYKTALGYSRAVTFQFEPDNGKFHFYLSDDEIYTLTSFNSWSAWNSAINGCCEAYVNLPFPENWDLTENGIEVDWLPNGWVANCESFRLIPFWHEAE